MRFCGCFAASLDLQLLCTTVSFCSIGYLKDFSDAPGSAVLFATDVAARGLNLPYVSRIFFLFSRLFSRDCMPTFSCALLLGKYERTGLSR